ncbi:toxin [Arthrobacter sp. UM1]|uniref:toxin n=1 Tax=Arthrobacter sp. UM1 TaxID=2766776 RepID=UPI001CF635CE|nr:toxin [Arthrobacter sp. UM1]MCB4208446.1 toxin [Arthrobacter sp. UM1]
MKINHSALKHGLSEADILCAAEHRVFESEPDEDMPAKQFILGFDTHGRVLELVVLTFDSGNQLVIHAMKARSRYLDLLR